MLFTVEEILAHSVSGKASNSNTVAEPKLDGEKLEVLKNEATSSQRTAVQK